MRYLKYVKAELTLSLLKVPIKREGLLAAVPPQGVEIGAIHYAPPFVTMAPECGEGLLLYLVGPQYLSGTLRHRQHFVGPVVPSETTR